MNVEKLPTWLLSFATLVFLGAGIGLYLLLTFYKPAIPSPIAVSTSPMEQENAYLLSARDVLLELEPDQRLSFKTYQNSAPRYFKITDYSPTGEAGVFKIVFSTENGAPLPEEVENGFIHLRQPIKKGLLETMMH